MSEHAVLSASSSERWISCPGSVELCKDIPRTTSKYADEGTKAHEVAASTLLGTPIPCDNEEMTEGAVAWRKLIEDLRGNGTLFVEKRVDYSSYIGVPDSFGTADAIIVSEDGKEIIISDYKYGRGVKIDADNNSQLMLYALGAIDEVSVLGYEPERIRLVIHQPRLSHISEWDCSVETLMEFAVKAKRSAQLAMSKDASLNPSESACRFCPGKAICLALANFVAKTAELPFDVLVDEPTPEQLNLVEDWIKAKRAEIEKRLFDGEKLDHWKLVAGRAGKRAWTDEKQAEELLKSFRLKQEDIYDMSLISPTIAEKLFKEQPRRWGKVAELISRSEGKPSVASISDKRPALEVTAIDTLFEVIETIE